MIHPIPSGTRDVLPQETGEVRAITDTLRARVRRSRLRRDLHAGAGVRVGARARGHGRSAAGLPRVRRVRRGAGAALGHDRADRARGRHALRRQRAAAALLLLRPLLPRRAPAARPAARAAAGGHRADRLAGARGHRRGADGAVPLARRGRPEGLPRGHGRRFAVPGADGEPAGARAGARGAAARRSYAATSSSSGQRLHDAGLAGEAAELLLDVPQRRGGPELLDRRAGAGRRGRDGHAPRARAARRPTSPSA